MQQPEGEGMKRRRLRVLQLPVLGALALSACHHVIIDGGLEPSDTRYDEEWNLAFASAIYPAQVDAADRCGGYFSRIETRQSFLNLVVATWTVGWISPLQVRLDCGVPASGGASNAEGPHPATSVADVREDVGKETDHAR